LSLPLSCNLNSAILPLYIKERKVVRGTVLLLLFIWKRSARTVPMIPCTFFLNPEEKLLHPSLLAEFRVYKFQRVRLDESSKIAKNKTHHFYELVGALFSARNRHFKFLLEN